jgi:hypothetical protein
LAETRTLVRMANTFESATSPTRKTDGSGSAGWVKLAVVAAASVFASGLAAVWWYKKAVKQLRQAEEDASNPHYGICGDDPSDEP